MKYKGSRQNDGNLKGGFIMIEIIKLIEYSELAGFPLSINGNNLRVGNGTNLPFHLKRQLTIHKDEILTLLKSGQGPRVS